MQPTNIEPNKAEEVLEKYAFWKYIFQKNYNSGNFNRCLSYEGYSVGSSCSSCGVSCSASCSACAGCSSAKPA